jgi:hypothetical protein
MSYWNISLEKVKLESGQIFKQKLSLDLWRKIVNEDKDLFWSENTPLGIEAKNSGLISKELINKREQKNAQMDFVPKYGHGNVHLNFNINDGYISIHHTRDSLKRIEKYFELAKKLRANLYRSGTTLIDEKKMEKIRSKYLEKGKIAPKDD